jgi:peptidoglycan/xylan/chitin deacetylase (PgdA/CDA1 family)
MKFWKKLQKYPYQNLAAMVAVLLIAVLTIGYTIFATQANIHALNTVVSTHYDIKPAGKAKPTLKPTEVPTKIIKESSKATSKAPILMYHYVRTVDRTKDNLGYGLSVTPEDFAAQMAWLSENGFQTVKLNDYCTGSVTVAKPIILTFDDGYEDMYTNALPILQKYNFIGTFFIVNNFTGRNNYLTQDQINLMQSAGMELGSHTLDHKNLADLAEVQQKNEIENSQQASPVFAYPTGNYNAITLKLVSKAGYSCAVTVNPGISNTNSYLFQLPRLRISGGMSLDKFKQNITEGR